MRGSKRDKDKIQGKVSGNVQYSSNRTHGGMEMHYMRCTHKRWNPHAALGQLDGQPPRTTIMVPGMLRQAPVAPGARKMDTTPASNCGRLRFGSCGIEYGAPSQQELMHVGMMHRVDAHLYDVQTISNI
jgi:hypothetical protein